MKKSGSARAPPLIWPNLRSLHRAFVVEAILVVLDDGRDGFQRKAGRRHPLPRPADRKFWIGMWFLPYLNGPRSDLKFAFSISAFIASFLLVSPFTATTAL